jgi:hypothetical protein
VTFAKIATGQAVTSLNSLTDNVRLEAGSNITITPSGNTLTIGAVAPTSTAYYAFRLGTGRLDNPGQDVASKQVPAGAYVIFFRTQLFNQDHDEQLATCSLGLGARSEATILLKPLGVMGEEFMELREVATFSAPTTITVHCSGFNVKAELGRLIAFRFDAIESTFDER